MLLIHLWLLENVSVFRSSPFMTWIFPPLFSSNEYENTAKIFLETFLFTRTLHLHNKNNENIYFDSYHFFSDIFGDICFLYLSTSWVNVLSSFLSFFFGLACVSEIQIYQFVVTKIGFHINNSGAKRTRKILNPNFSILRYSQLKFSKYLHTLFSFCWCLTTKFRLGCF